MAEQQFEPKCALKISAFSHVTYFRVRSYLQISNSRIPIYFTAENTGNYIITYMFYSWRKKFDFIK